MITQQMINNLDWDSHKEVVKHFLAFVYWTAPDSYRYFEHMFKLYMSAVNLNNKIIDPLPFLEQRRIDSIEQLEIDF